MPNEHSNSVRIQQLNDAFRRSFVGGVVVVTAGFESLPAERRGLILAKVRAFDQGDVPIIVENGGAALLALSR